MEQWRFIFIGAIDSPQLLHGLRRCADTIFDPVGTCAVSPSVISTHQP
jgi:hypothetical protein